MKMTLEKAEEMVNRFFSLLIEKYEELGYQKELVRATTRNPAANNNDFYLRFKKGEQQYKDYLIKL